MSGEGAEARIPLFCDIALAERIERVEAELVARASAAADRRTTDTTGFVIPIAGGVASFAEQGSPFNKVAGLGFGGVPSPAALDEIEHAFSACGAPVQIELAHLAEGSGRVINVSSVLGLVPAPFGALYAATKHAIEGYSESLDHEIREYGIRVLLVEPAYTRTSFDANAIPADEPLPLYERRREVQDVVLAEAIKGGDEPSVVGEAIVAAATDARPKLRYPAGTLARRVSKLRRYAPSNLFDRQIRKINQLAA